ncbi:MAG: YfhO family protein [Geobacteraceae bacterium]|nr:YfhO family protein [Geobacteraceae bacterium]
MGAVLPASPALVEKPAGRRKDLLFLAALLALLVICFSKILFTGMIVRAPDITNEFLWTVKGFKEMGFADLLRISLRPAWDLYINSGTSDGGGTLSMQFLLYRSLLFWLLPLPSSIAWFMVLHLFFGAAGTYCLCRIVGAGRLASFLGGLVFALAPENASLINAGHVQKIATISFAPWAFYFFEKGFKTRRLIFFLATGVVLAFQFFNMHWQIAYYTCLGIGAYGVMRTAGIMIRDRRERKPWPVRLLAMNIATVLFFLSTVAISLVPLADWSRDTTRGVQSGANQGKGGLVADQAMSWSLPPEEAITFIVPGFFGFSRQEGAYDSDNIKAYYWGRMVFTQTSDYMGLLPWLLLPLPLIFRRDAFTWIALAAVAGGVLFSMGKFTPFYWFLYEHFPGVNHFRVPKMMMFLPVLGLAVLAARGLDLLRDAEVRKSAAFGRYLAGIIALPVALVLLLVLEIADREYWLARFNGLLALPDRFSPGAALVAPRWNNLVAETGIALALAGIHAGIIFAFYRGMRMLRWLPLILVALYVADTGRVNAKFMLLQDMPQKVKSGKTPAMEFLARDLPVYRVLPMNGTDPMQYAANGIPVMFTSNPVQQQRWQDFLEAFSFNSSMSDMINLKYLVYDTARYEQEKVHLGDRFVPVFTSPDGRETVLQNRKVLPKGWLVPSAGVLKEPGRVMELLQSPAFDPRRFAVVETPPPIPLADPNEPPVTGTGAVAVTRYKGGDIRIEADASRNALLVLGEKYFRGWRATVDGRGAEIYPVNHVLSGVYLAKGKHAIELAYDPLPFKLGKWLTLISFGIFALMLVREFLLRRRAAAGEGT